MHNHTALLLLTGSAFALASPAYSAAVGNGKLVEDFTTLDYADLTVTTGLWNIVNQRAQAGAVAGGNASHPISFGDGSDGVLDLSSGSFTFDTDSHPSGYNFISVNIGSGVTLHVTGSKPLIIRSLSTMTISAALSADGGFTLGDATANGVANNPGFPAGPAGGTGHACSGTGGAGGNNPNASTANNGTSGLQAGGGLEGDQGDVTGAPNPVDGSPALTTPGASNTFDTGGFFCGTGGGGGAAQTNGAQYATGGAGGAGGGAIHLIAVGNLSVSTISANGGNGGNGAIYSGSSCSGNGGGGTGGAVWLQTLNTLSASSTPSVAAGTGGTCNGAGAVASFAGSLRCDFAQGSGPACDPNDETTDQQDAPGSVSYTVQSKSYDLGVINAEFSTPTISENAASGTITISYQGSSDGVNFGTPTQDVTTLSNQRYRYLKFSIRFVTASGASGYPTVSRIEIPFQDLGLDPVAFSLGCGTTYDHRGDDSGQGGRSAAFWASLFLSGYLWTKLKRPKVSSTKS